ncbi:MAG: VWA domain-containing protein [Spirochaetales bacterium]|nr:VWA domain-containing protein [Spirochaetales bacterium]
MIFSTPVSFIFIPIIALIYILPGLTGKRSRGIKFSSSYQLKTGVVSLRQRLIFLPEILMIAGLVLATAALARPRVLIDEKRNITEGVAMELFIDRSGSMNAELLQGRTYVRKMDIVKQTLRDFVLGNGKELPGRPDDLIGLIAFARYADTLSPLSLSHDIIGDFLSSLNTVSKDTEDGTSIGDSIALAAARLQSVEDQNSGDKRYTVKSKIIILLTDGNNNAGKYSPLEAAAFAKKWGIKIYAIGFAGDASYVTSTLFGNKRVSLGSAVDSGALKELTSLTDGKYFEANTSEELSQIYEEIDKLEKSEIVSFNYVEYRELFNLFILPALFFIALGKILSMTILRRIK